MDWRQTIAQNLAQLIFVKICAYLLF
jgi:hypothetical protein